MKRKTEDWVTCGKTIRHLIKELQSFENQDLEVRVSIDGGENHYPISIVGKDAEKEEVVCILRYFCE